MAAGKNRALLADQVAELGVPYVACDDDAGVVGARAVPMEELVALPGVDVVVVAIPGTHALRSSTAVAEAVSGWLEVVPVSVEP